MNIDKIAEGWKPHMTKAEYSKAFPSVTLKEHGYTIPVSYSLLMDGYAKHIDNSILAALPRRPRVTPKSREANQLLRALSAGRRGKPSYRQRQKRGRLAKSKRGV